MCVFFFYQRTQTADETVAPQNDGYTLASPVILSKNEIGQTFVKERRLTAEMLELHDKVLDSTKNVGRKRTLTGQELFEIEPKGPSRIDPDESNKSNQNNNNNNIQINDILQARNKAFMLKQQQQSQNNDSSNINTNKQKQMGKGIEIDTNINTNSNANININPRVTSRSQPPPMSNRNEIKSGGGVGGGGGGLAMKARSKSPPKMRGGGMLEQSHTNMAKGGAKSQEIQHNQRQFIRKNSNNNEILNVQNQENMDSAISVGGASVSVGVGSMAGGGTVGGTRGGGVGGGVMSRLQRQRSPDVYSENSYLSTIDGMTTTSVSVVSDFTHTVGHMGMSVFQTNLSNNYGNSNNNNSNNNNNNNNHRSQSRSQSPPRKTHNVTKSGNHMLPLNSMQTRGRGRGNRKVLNQKRYSGSSKSPYVSLGQGV